MRFRYLKDPLFLACVAIYSANKLSRLLAGGTDFQNAYVNDLICMPFWVPIMLVVNRILGLRAHDRPPGFYEIAIPVLVWSAAFELVFPYTSWFCEYSVADPNDVLCYCAGGLVAGLFWKSYYRNGPRPCRAQKA